MNNKGLRTVVSIGAALAVLFFGSGSHEGRDITNAVLVLAVVAGVFVWCLTKPGTGKPVS